MKKIEAIKSTEKYPCAYKGKDVTIYSLTHPVLKTTFSKTCDDQTQDCPKNCHYKNND